MNSPVYSTLYDNCINRTSLESNRIYSKVIKEHYEDDDCDCCDSDLANFLVNDYLSPEQSFMNEKENSNNNTSVWGPNAWKFLHISSFSFSDNPSHKEKKAATDFFNSISSMLPCDICSEHCEKYLKDHPPDVRNKTALSTWLVNFHNIINKRLGKPQISYKQAKKLYDNGNKTCPAN
tara:strand:- start:284 stop:817 length:534 start_codon:yes stop_codon:yes gene_type:complete